MHVVRGMHFLFGPLRIEHLTVNTTGKQVYLQCQLPPCTTNQLQDLQDHISRMLIGAGERKDGLCYFRNKQRVCVLKVGVVGLLYLWQRRLGHPLYK
ncbi:uncharacterized protein [Nicotiana tomentosiformis]|uniref:uncharacterized protein isoform X2 n=1 Tax=Nicotiana tomentosiformis TaxID=4098 RepID=UPI000878C0D5|nr:uncharacterized protein LOC108947219 isoform X2 [Nicotiana tomentosiformis]XP_018630381.1 uncharacterized protein LOC108947219 isoform X2 [Nicotiana tomentosiformis]